MRRVTPKVFLVGETAINENGMQDYLAHIGAPEWKSDAPSASEKLMEFMGRLCYRSWRPGMNANVSKVREGNAGYLGNIVNVKHGSVLEHPVTNWVFADVSRVFTHELVRHRAGAAYCLSGDALIHSVRNVNGRPNGTRTRTLRQLYEMNKTSHGRSRMRLLRLRVLDETSGKFTSGRVKAVTSSGPKEVFEVELEKGYRCKMTRDHRVLTDQGWMRLEDVVGSLKVGAAGLALYGEQRAKIAVNGLRVPVYALVLESGTPAYLDRHWIEERVRRGVRLVDVAVEANISEPYLRKHMRELGLAGLARSLKLTARAGNKGQHYKLRSKTSDERSAIAARMTGAGNHRWRGGGRGQQMLHDLRLSILQRDSYRCKMCGKAPSRRKLHVHHIDLYAPGKASNSDPNNLITLCSACHGHIGGKEREYASQLFSLLNVPPRRVQNSKRHISELVPKFVSILGIRYVGTEDTYDIEMEGPHHNFIADGLVVHNSQESLRFVRLTDLGLWLPPEAEAQPWLVELFEKTFKDMEALQLAMAEKLGLDDEGRQFKEKKVLTSMMRRLAPDGLATTIGASFNFRALRHIIEMRTAESAETEIRIAFDQVAKICKERWPNIFGDFSCNAKGEWITENRKV